MSNEISKGILQAVGVIAGVLLLGWFLYKVQSVLAYLFLSFVVTLVGRPIVLFLRNRLRFRNLWAVITTMLIIFGLFFSLLLLFIPLVKQQGHNLSLLNMESLRASSQRLYTEAIAYFSGDNAEVEKTLLEAPWFENFDFSSLSNFVNELFSILGSFSIGLFSVIFISFFLLKDSRLMESSLLSLVSDSKTESVSRSFLKIKNLLSRYFIGLIFQVLVLFIIYSSVLLIFGIDNAIVIAFLCALLNIIPYLGPSLVAF